MYKLLREIRSWVAQRLARPTYILGVWREPGFKSYNSHYSPLNLSEVALAGFTREKIGQRYPFASRHPARGGIMGLLPSPSQASR